MKTDPVDMDKLRGRTDTHFQWATPPEGLPFLTFSGRLNLDDLADLQLDAIDRAVLFSPADNAADMLQSLEIVFRRMAQQSTTKATGLAEQGVSHDPSVAD